MYAKPLIGQNIRYPRRLEFSSVVLIVEYSKEYHEFQSNIICTGTLLTHSHILTAEHCLSKFLYYEIQVVFKARNLQSRSVRNIMWWVAYNQWITKNHMNLEYEVNDIAVIKLTNQVLTEIIPAVYSPLPNHRLYGLDVIIVGHDYAYSSGSQFSTMKIATVQLISNTMCYNKINNIVQSEINIPDKILCSISTPFVLLQEGDSGGPVFHGNAIIAVNLGIYPDLNETYNSHKVNFHLAVSTYGDFIDYNLNE